MITETKPNDQVSNETPKIDKPKVKRSMRELQRMFLEVLTDDDMNDVARKLVDIAVEGDFRAIKLFLSYTLGKPETMWASLESTLMMSETKSAASKPSQGLGSLPASGFGDASQISLVSNGNKRRNGKRNRR